MIHVDYVFVKKNSGHCLNSVHSEAPRHQRRIPFPLFCCRLSGRAKEQQREGQHCQLVPGWRINQAKTPSSGAVRGETCGFPRFCHPWDLRAHCHVALKPTRESLQQGGSCPLPLPCSVNTQPTVQPQQVLV